MTELRRAFRLAGQQGRSYPACVALVGAGGKTTALFTLARQLCCSESGGASTVLITTTTHLGIWQLSRADMHQVIERPEQVKEIFAHLPAGVVVLTGLGDEMHRVCGLSTEGLAQLAEMALQQRLALLIEADGSRLRPLKAPADYEPAIPSFVDLVVVVSGMCGVGKPLTEEWVHRPQIFAHLSGLGLGEVVTPAALAKVLAHPQGGLKNIPGGSRRAVLLSQAETSVLQAQAQEVAERLLGAYPSIVIASQAGEMCSSKAGMQETEVAAVVEKTAGIVLAAGGSHRFGQPKQLLEWQGETLVHRAARTALEAGLVPVVVVLGAYADEIGEAVRDLPVRVVNNTQWQRGQGSSVVVGVGALTDEVGSAVFLLADQPRVQPGLIRALVQEHQSTLAAIIAPLIDGERGNPVLFDRDTFPELSRLEGDQGGRVLFGRYPVQWLPWHDRSPLLDVDTEEDFRHLVEDAE